MFCKHLLVYMIGIFHCLLIVLKNTVPSPIILIDVIERALSFKIPEKSRTLLILPQNQNIQNSESSVPSYDLLCLHGISFPWEFPKLSAITERRCYVTHIISYLTCSMKKEQKNVWISCESKLP